MTNFEKSMIRLQKLDIKFETNKKSMTIEERDERDKLHRSQNADAKRKNEKENNAFTISLFETLIQAHVNQFD